MNDRSQPERVLRTAVGALLWAVSGALTTGLYIELAGTNVLASMVLVIMAVALEGAKVLTWRMGKGYRLLSCSLIAMSLLGSLGAALETVETFRASRFADSQSTVQANTEIRSLDQQVDTLLNRLSQMPADFVTAGKELTAELDRLRAERSQLVSSLGQIAAVPEHPTMFDLLARAFGLPTETLLLALLVFLSVNLEAAAVVLSGHGRPIGQNPTEYFVSSQTFLEAAKDGAALPILHGRDVTAKKLGISYYHGKRLVRELTRSGIIRVVGKRLVLNQQT